MLECNAETYRVEETMVYILSTSHYQKCEAYALATGLFLTLSDPSKGTITRVKRVKSQNTNLNKIYQVNSISRQLVKHEVDVESAYNQLQTLDKVIEYSPIISIVALVVMVVAFVQLLNGGPIEMIAAFVGAIIYPVFQTLKKMSRMDTFMYNVVSLMSIVTIIVLLKKSVFPDLKVGISITAILMPAVPGTAITNAIRDTFRGDYNTSAARILEAFVIALSIALGVTLGLLITKGWSLI